MRNRRFEGKIFFKLLFLFIAFERTLNNIHLRRTCVSALEIYFTALMLKQFDFLGL